MTEWKDKSEAEKVAIYKAVNDVYVKYENPKWLQKPEASTAYVNVLMQNQQVEQGGKPAIEGKAPKSEQELVDKLTQELTEASQKCFDISLSVGYGVGTKFGGMQDVNKVMTEGTCNVEHNEGEVLLVDFWATWCPPCQGPMAHNQEMLEKHKAEWQGKVRIIGASIDNDAPTAKNHVQAKKWTDVEHYHVRKAGCKASEEYGVQGVPHCLLVDTQGTIVWMGHPASRKDLVDDFNKLLKGEKLADLPAEAATGGDAPAPIEGMEDAAAKEQVDKFKAAAKEMMDNNKDAFQFPRAFLVLEDTVLFDPATDTLKHKMICHKQIMGGTQETQNKAKGLLANIKGEWEEKEMFRL